MFTIEDAELQYLKRLGARLERRRVEKNERQEAFAARLGISPPTYRKMVKGDPNVKVGYWVQALYLMGSIEDLDQLLADRSSFFSVRDEQQSVDPTRPRKRIRRKI